MGRVCAAGTCVAPGTGGTGGTGGGVGMSGTGGRTSDAGDAGGGRCDPSQPFGEPKLVPGLNAVPNACARFSPDERTVYLGVFNGAQQDVATASRGSVSEPFGPIGFLDALNTEYHESCPFVTEDGLSLYFESDRSGSYRILVSTRAQTNDAFPAPQPVAELNAEFEGGVYFASGNGALSFHSARSASNSNLYRVERIGGGHMITLLAGVNSARDEYNPVPASDELSLYFGLARLHQPAEPSNMDIFVATRATPYAAFGPPVAVDSLNMPAVDEAPSWLSPDGCRLYLTRNDPASGNLIYVTEKTR